MEDFLATAELKNEDYETQKLNTVVIESNAFVQVRHEPTEEQLEEFREFWDSLRVPRRPKWTRDMNADVLHQMERESFLEWRRNLARVEERESISMTPFEKNLNVWRQLWRVVEMSNVLVQIVDARDPELFRCQDLETYTKEVGQDKMCVLLLNKADLLTANQRRLWAEYYKSIGVHFYFFSAKQEEVVEKTVEEEKGFDKMSNDAAPNGLEDDLDNVNYSEEEVDEEVMLEEPNEGKVEDIVGRRAFIELLKGLQKHFPQEEKLKVGFCGYPNVGKSSTINKLMGEKKVTVSSTPGKTKHFQSLFLEEELCVLDCPGLVFPNFVTNKATMVCNGLLPIDELRDWRSPGSVVCQRIKRNVLEAQYGIILPDPDAEKNEDLNRPPTIDELLSAYAYVRGFMGVSGAPNMSRAARLVLKDYVNGVLRYAAAPPGEFGKDFDSQEGQEQACAKKLDQVKKFAPNEKRTPTYVEVKHNPKVDSVSMHQQSVAKERNRRKVKEIDDKKMMNKMKRGGKGKHKKDVDYPYGYPPDMPQYSSGTAKN
jgi:large subunit GTPase 1